MKYGYQVPLYRQEQMLTSQGIDLDRATLALWMGRLAWWLKPLHDVLLDSVLSYPKLFADETPLPVLDPGRGKTKTCRLWVAAMDDRPWGGPAPPAVVYVFAEDRKGERATDLFAGFSGILQVDGYADRRFRFHHGIDPVGLFRAVLANALHRGISQGGSTITQQLAKNLFLPHDRNLMRKPQGEKFGVEQGALVAMAPWMAWFVR
jgi:Transposase IS66 family/Transglycosylase